MAYRTKAGQAKAARRHYLKNTERMKARAIVFTKQARIRNREIVREHLSQHPCVDCGNGDVRVLDFDHVRGIKRGNMCDLVRGSFGVQTIMREIEKCEIRCANCHRIKTRAAWIVS
jgi:hypothetical protein